MPRERKFNVIFLFLDCAETFPPRAKPFILLNARMELITRDTRISRARVKLRSFFFQANPIPSFISGQPSIRSTPNRDLIRTDYLYLN